MSCEAFESLIALEVGGDLELSGRQRLEEHLATCASCREFAAGIQDSYDAVSSLAQVSLDPAVLDSVRSSVLREVEKSSSPRLVAWLPLGRRELAMAAGLILTLSVALLLRSNRPELTPTVEVPATSTPTVEVPPTSSSGGKVPGTSAAGDSEVPGTSAAGEVPGTSAAGVSAPATSTTTLEAPGTSAFVSAEVPGTSATDERLELVEASTLPSGPIAGPTTHSDPETPAPTVIHWVAEEADVVIYWLIDPPIATTEEKKDEMSAV